MRDEIADGWKVSQVEALVGLPRRDIQRACYDGAGGFGIVHPRNSSWGWRVYEVSDMAKLFLLAQARKQPCSADDIRRKFAKCEDDGIVRKWLLRVWQHFDELADANLGVALQSRAFWHAIDRGGSGVFAEMLDATFAQSARDWGRTHEMLRLASEEFFSSFLERAANAARVGEPSGCDEAKAACSCAIAELSRSLGVRPAEAAAILAHALNAPGVALACELWLGAATHSFVNTALESATVEMEKGAFDGRAE